jgi:predicted RNA-binding Zn-ribbon protein involved in translation (DUF1610 family)
VSVRFLIGDVRERRRGPPPGTALSPAARAARPRTRAALEPALLCRSCGWSWSRTAQQINHACPSCGANVDARDRKGATRNVEKLKEWRQENPDLARASAKAGRELIRRAALLVVGDGRLACVGCGCDDYRALEINHKNGGGNEEFRRLKSKFYRDIAHRSRPTPDLEILCKVCNARHAVELKFGPLPYRIEWGPA